MIQIPSQFQLGPRTWDVLIVDQMPDTESDEDCFGLCDPVHAVIYLLSGLPPAFLRTVWWHEFFHALKFTMGLDDHDEAEVDAVGQLLAQFDKSRNGKAVLFS